MYTMFILAHFCGSAEPAHPASIDSINRSWCELDQHHWHNSVEHKVAHFCSLVLGSKEGKFVE